MLFGANLGGLPRFTKVFGAIMDIKEFVRVFRERAEGATIKIPKAMEAAFADPQTEQERQIKALIVAYDADQTSKTEQELFRQTKRLADAERTLQSKTTKAATESKRIAVDKIEKAKGKLADLRRADLKPCDSRIFPGSYAPVMFGALQVVASEALRLVGLRPQPVAGFSRIHTPAARDRSAAMDPLRSRFWECPATSASPNKGPMC